MNFCRTSSREFDEQHGGFVSLAQLEGFDSVFSCLSSWVFGGGCDLDAAEDRMRCAADEALSYSAEPIPGPLLVLSEDDAATAVWVFPQLLNYINLSNKEENKERKTMLASEIANKIRGNGELENEVCLQLVRQTRRNPDPIKHKNAWRAFIDIVEAMPLQAVSPCTVVHQLTTLAQEKHLFVQSYLKSVGAQKDEDPWVRVMAFAVLDVLMGRNSEGATTNLSVTAERHLSSEVFTLSVLFPDGNARQLIYDLDILVSDAVKQLAWSDGHQNSESYALFEDRGEGYLLLDQSKRLAAVLIADLSFGDGWPSLRFDKILSRITEEEKADNIDANISFVHWMYQYLAGVYHVQPSLASQLCVLQIQASQEYSVFQNPQRLSKLVSKWIPEVPFKKHTKEEWIRSVTHRSNITGRIDRQEAQLQFLHVVRGLRCDKCIKCRVRTIEEFPADVAEDAELKLVVSCSGILFFSQEPSQCLLAVDFAHIVSFKSDAETLFMEVQIEKQLCYIRLVCHAGESVCMALNAHRTDWTASSSFQHRNALHPNLAAPPSLLECDAGDHLDKADGEVFQEGLPDTQDFVTRQDKQGTSIERSASCKESPFVTCLRDGRLEPRDSSGHFPGRDLPPRSSLSSMSAISCTGSISSASAIMKRRSVEDFSHLLDTIKNLREGCTFVGKYRIQSGGVCGKSRILYAEQVYSKDAVVLKFYASRRLFENSKNKHKRLQKSQCVCRMIDYIDKEDYPPCLVFQRGDITLKEWMQKTRSDLQRKEALFQILNALIDLHGSQIVHCDLTPNNVMFFSSDHRWKVLDLDSAVFVGPAAEVYTTLRYAPPEIVQAQERGEHEIDVQTSADMWSFGIILFEVMAEGKTFFNPENSQESIKELLCSGTELVDNACLKSIKEEQVRSLIKHLVCPNPEDRRPARESADHAIFSSALSTTQKQDYERTCSRRPGFSIGITPLSLDQVQEANLMASIRMERFTNHARSDDAYFEEEDEVMAVADLCLPDNPVFVLIAGESYSLRISLLHDGVAEVPIRRVLSVRMLSADGSVITLETQDGPVDSTKCEVVALLPPFETESTTSVDSLLADRNLSREHLTLELMVTVGMSAHLEHVREINQKLHCRIVPPGTNLETKTFVRKYDYGWERVPHWKAAGVNASLALGNITLDIK